MRFNNVVACGRNTLICIKHTPSGGESANNAEMDATQILDAYIKLHTDYSIQRGGTILVGGIRVDPNNEKAGKLLIAITQEMEN